MATTDLSKLTGYLVTGAPVDGVSSTKLTGYVTGGAATTGTASTKLTGYVVGGAATASTASTKLVGYLVVDATEEIYKVTQTVTFSHCAPPVITMVQYVTIPVEV